MHRQYRSGARRYGGFQEVGVDGVALTINVHKDRDAARSQDRGGGSHPGHGCRQHLVPHFYANSQQSQLNSRRSITHCHAVTTIVVSGQFLREFVALGARQRSAPRALRAVALLKHLF